MGGAWHGVDAPCYHCERASKSLLIWKERMQPSKAPMSWAHRGRICQDMGRMQPSERHSPLETAEEGYVGTQGKSNLVRGTNEQGSAEGGTGQER